MDQKRVLWLGAGALLAIVIAIGLAMMMSSGHKEDKRMNDQPTGLQFNVSETSASMDSKKPLRCYVNGAEVGDMTLEECAQKNGVAAQKLDVGLDDNGNMTAAPTGSLAPVPTAPTSAAANAKPLADANPADNGEVVPDTKPIAAGPAAACLRFNGGEWNKLSDGLTLGQCVQLLYDGRCVSPGSAQYGRWGEKTLRLVPHRVEQSDDNSNFRTLVDQSQGCQVPMVR
jgi:hypothetical protein